ncbi:MAG: hypothetical protein ACI8TQ_002239 [Planctomycetota bacterium]|jgi:hypothetical protein
MVETNYAAVTGDLVASKKAPADFRAKVQRETIKVINELNHELDEYLVRPAVLTAGDEIQALFSAPSQVVRFVQTIKDRLYGAGEPTQDIVFGLGWGPLSTGLLTEALTVEHLDGPCFHQARETLNMAKKKQTWVVLKGFGEELDRTLCSLFELMSSIRGDWTAKQSWYTVELRRLGKRIALAEYLGKSPSVITESLQRSHFDAILNGEQAVRCILQQFDPGKK